MATLAPAAGQSGTKGTAPEATAERRLVTVLFADLVGFTTLAEDRDPEAVRELLSSYFDRATEVITTHGGTIEKFIGDAVMAVWGTPVAHEDDAERAVRAALQLVESVAALNPGLQARAGVLTGEAAVTLGATNQGMVAGDLVNTAARLQGAAEPGTVLVGETTRRAAERAIAFEALGDHSLKGKTTPVPAWRAMRVMANRGGQGRSDSLEPPFVGRDEELRQLKEALQSVGREQRPRLVSVTGVGGIGKSRLVWELEKYVDGVNETIWWHRGRSPSYGEGITFWPLGEMVRRRADLTEDADDTATRSGIGAMLSEFVLDDAERARIGPALLSLLGVEPAPAGGRDALFPAWRLLFERIAAKGTTVLVFEDLHWADTGTLDFIEHLLEWSRGLPIMVVTLARPELFDRRPDWGAGRRSLTALALEPLPDEAVRQLLDGVVPGLPADAMAAIVGRAEGVPLYAVEMVRGLLSDGLIERRGDTFVPAGDLSTLRVPESLRSLIASRLDALDAADRGLLQDASVLGQVFAPEALAAVHGMDAGEVEERLRSLARRELLDTERDPKSPERGQYKFVQSLIREVAYGTLARRDRRSRHLAVARHYESVGDDEMAGALANHYVAAHAASDEGAEADAIEAQARLALAGAADRAAGLGAHKQAIAYIDQALGITSAAVDRAPLLDRAARSASAAATPDAKRYALEAIDAYRIVGDRVAIAAATSRLGRVLLDASQLAEAVTVLEAGLPDAEGVDDPTPLASMLANLSRAHMRLGEPERSIEYADRALAIAERRNLVPIVAEALGNKAASLTILGRRREAIALYAAVVEMAAAGADRAFEIRARNNAASALADDDPIRSQELMAEALELAEDIGDRSNSKWILGSVAVVSLGAGTDWDRHRQRLGEAFDASDRPTDRIRLLTFIALYRNAVGERIEETVAELDALVGDDTGLEPTFAKLMIHGDAALALGKPAEAYRHARAAWDLHLPDLDIPTALMLRSAIRSADPELIRAAADVMRELPGSGTWTAINRQHADAAIAAVEGRPADAVAGFTASFDGCQGIGQMYERASVAIDALVLLPDDPVIRAHAEEVRPLLEELGARSELAALERALGDLSGAAQKRPADAAVEAVRD
ncbi:MAG: AAA family ATPase [Candidatus Limnocylindria bacterium]